MFGLPCRIRTYVLLLPKQTRNQATLTRVGHATRTRTVDRWVATTAYALLRVWGDGLESNQLISRSQRGLHLQSFRHILFGAPPETRTRKIWFLKPARMPNSVSSALGQATRLPLARPGVKTPLLDNFVFTCIVWWRMRESNSPDSHFARVTRLPQSNPRIWYSLLESNQRLRFVRTMLIPSAKEVWRYRRDSNPYVTARQAAASQSVTTAWLRI